MTNMINTGISITESDRIARNNAVKRAERQAMMAKLGVGDGPEMSPADTDSFYANMEPGEATVREEQFVRENKDVAENEQLIEWLRPEKKPSKQEGIDFGTPIPFPKTGKDLFPDITFGKAL